MSIEMEYLLPAPASYHTHVSLFNLGVINLQEGASGGTGYIEHNMEPGLLSHDEWTYMQNRVYEELSEFPIGLNRSTVENSRVLLRGPKVANHIAWQRLLICQCRDTIDGVMYWAILDCEEARHTVGIPYQFKQWFHWIMTQTTWDGSLDRQIYDVCVWIDQ